MLQFTSHRGEVTLVDPSEIVAVRQSGGDFEGSAIIVLRSEPDPFGPRRVPEIFVKESSTQVAEALAAYATKSRPAVVAVEYAKAWDGTLSLGKIVTSMIAEGWQLDGPVTVAEKPRSDEDVRRYGKESYFIQRLVKYA